MTDAEISARITKLRTSLLVFRFMYYAWSESLITDFEYDRRETELKGLVAQYPALEADAAYADICPTRTVGSNLHEDYPLEILDLAERLVETHAALEPDSQPVPLADIEKDLDRLAESLAQLSQPKLVQPGLF